MAHSIIEFADRHLTIPDDELIEVLETLSAQLEINPNESLSFLPEFLASDMVHVNGGVDPEFEVHLNSKQMLDEFQYLITQARDESDGAESQRLLSNLQKIQDLVFGLDNHVESTAD